MRLTPLSRLFEKILKLLCGYAGLAESDTGIVGRVATAQRWPGGYCDPCQQVHAGRETVMGINGDYRSLAEACGEATHHTGWVAGEDFDPSDPEEMAVMELVWEREAAASESARNRELLAENARLRELLRYDDDCDGRDEAPDYWN
jgi:hypothetical protein